MNGSLILGVKRINFYGIMEKRKLLSFGLRIKSFWLRRKYTVGNKKVNFFDKDWIFKFYLRMKVEYEYFFLIVNKILLLRSDSLE